MILHAVYNSINSYEYASGSWKAVESNRLALQSAGLNARVVQFPKNDSTIVLKEVTPDIKHVLIEYSKWPDIVRQIKKKHPKVGVHVRTHNAEAYQYFHRHTGAGLKDYANPQLWHQCMSIIWRDTRCRQAADTLLGINDWDDAHYWQWLPGKALIRYLPYYSPWPYLRSEVEPQPWNLRVPAILSMGGNFDPSGMANVANLNRLATKLPRILGNRWSFLLTWWSQWHQKVPKVSEPVEVLRDCQEPWDLLCRVRAVAVLTPFGFGFKTTILDGLAAGCHVIVHPKLAKRLPLQVQQLCLICDPSRDEDIIKLADSFSTPPVDHDINERFRGVAMDVLRSTFV